MKPTRSQECREANHKECIGKIERENWNEQTSTIETVFVNVTDRRGKENSLQITGPNLKTTKNETQSETPGNLFLSVPEVREEALLPRVSESA